MEKERTTDAIEILHDRYIGDDPEKQKMLEEERTKDRAERESIPNSKPRVVITMEGGLIQDISSDTEMEVLVLDFDEDLDFSGYDKRIKKVKTASGEEEKAYVSLWDNVKEEKVVDLFFGQGLMD